MVDDALSMTGVAVDMLVQIQLAADEGSTVRSMVRCQMGVPVAASSAAMAFAADSVYTTVRVPRGVRTFSATSGAVNMAFPDSISIETSLSICVFHFSASRLTFCLEIAVSVRFQPLRSWSPPHVSHSRDRPPCACSTSTFKPAPAIAATVSARQLFPHNCNARICPSMARSIAARLISVNTFGRTRNDS